MRIMRITPVRVAYLHCDSGSSDKVYIVTLNRCNIGDVREWRIDVKYGRRGGTLNDSRQGEYHYESDAEAQYRKLLESKIKKGYQEVSADYALGYSNHKGTIVKLVNQATPKTTTSKTTKKPVEPVRKISFDL